MFLFLEKHQNFVILRKWEFVRKSYLRADKKLNSEEKRIPRKMEKKNVSYLSFSSTCKLSCPLMFSHLLMEKTCQIVKF